MSLDQDVGAALALPAVGSAGALDVADGVADGVVAGALVVGTTVGSLEGVGVWLVAVAVAVAGTDDVDAGAVLRARVRGEVAAGWGAAPPPAGAVD